MTFTPVDHDSRLPEHARCRGANHSDAGSVGHCDACGELVVRVEKEGRRPYLVPAGSTSGGMGIAYWCWRRHECDPAIVERRSAERAERLASGSVEKGATVEVVKGRKVPLGTVGVVRWIGEDAYGTAKVGLAVEGQERLVYTAKSNVEAKEAK